MTTPLPLHNDANTRALVVLILFQCLCTAFFVGDVLRDASSLGLVGLVDPHFLPEVGAVVGLVVGIAVELRLLMRMLRRQAHMAQGLGVAAGALADVMEAYFRAWGLTPAEQDVAGFAIKGYSNAEIATLRGSAEGTVKTHMNAVFRKAGVAGRAQLVSLLVEDLFRAPLVPSGEQR
jgi:DNA-binding CsgD family transcriptional regulator